jgi:hypothetical protein
MRRIIIASFSALALGTCAVAAQAQSAPPPMNVPPPPPAPKPFGVAGVIAAIAGDQITIKDDKGVVRTATLAPDALIIQIRKISIADIKPGSFVATANHPNGDNAGVSSELRVFGPEFTRKRLGEGSYPMDDGQNMTNGTVNTVVASPKGRELDVAYDGKGGKGVRHITVPADMVIRSMDAVPPSLLKAGAAARARLVPTADGKFIADRVIIGENGEPPLL